MNLMKKLAFTCSVITLVMSVSVITSYAQWGKKRSWQNRDSYSQSSQYRRAQNNRRWQARSAYRNNRNYRSANYRSANYRYANNRTYQVRNYRYANRNNQGRNYRYANRNYRSANYRNANRSYQNRNYRYIRVSPREARRIQRQRARQYQARNRYARASRLNYGERRGMANRQQQYRRNVYRVRY